MATEIPGIILAGGASRRMGGVDKTGLDLGGRTLLEHVHERLRSQVGEVVINANMPQDHHAPNLAVVPDSVPDRAGPLAGVLAGLEWAAGRGYDQIVTVAGDTPFFPEDLVARFCAAADRTPDHIMLAATRERSIVRCHPTFGLWPVVLRHDLAQALAAGTRKVVTWTDRHSSTLVEFAVTGVNPFFNVNTPGDLATIRRILAGMVA